MPAVVEVGTSICSTNKKAPLAYAFCITVADVKIHEAVEVFYWMGDPDAPISNHIPGYRAVLNALRYLYQEEIFDLPIIFKLAYTTDRINFMLTPAYVERSRRQEWQSPYMPDIERIVVALDYFKHRPKFIICSRPDIDRISTLASINRHAPKEQ